MKSILPVVAILLLPACMGGGGGMAASAAPPAQPVTASFSSMINQARTADGAGVITEDPRLVRAAQAHSDDMLDMRSMQHTGSDGSEVWDRVLREGYQYRGVGENIARGQQSEEEVFTAWMNSTTGHRENNLNPNHEHFGLAKAGSGSHLYWTLVLASER